MLSLGNPSHQVAMKLLYANCIPIMTYGSAVKQFTCAEMQSLNVAINDSIRKIFGYNRWESVRELRLSFGYESIYSIYANAKKRFLKGLEESSNPVLQHIYCFYEIEFI